MSRLDDYPDQVETDDGPSAAPVVSGSLLIGIMVVLGVVGAVGAWLYRHNQERLPKDFWGFDSHRIMADAPVVKATLIKVDSVFPPPPDKLWHEALFMITEQRYLIEQTADAAGRPEFAVEGEGSDDRETSLRQALRHYRSYDWSAQPWEHPVWRYALTFAKDETTHANTKHELKRTFQFTLVFDAQCRWVRLQMVNKTVALEPGVQARMRTLFTELFPGSDVVAPAPAATAPDGSPSGSAAPAPTGPLGRLPPTALSTATGMVGETPVAPAPFLPPASSSTGPRVTSPTVTSPIPAATGPSVTTGPQATPAPPPPMPTAANPAATRPVPSPAGPATTVPSPTGPSPADPSPTGPSLSPPIITPPAAPAVGTPPAAAPTGK